MTISIDSRTLKPGDTFIPVIGKTHDGRDFIPEAIAKGAHVLDVNLTDYARDYRKKLKCAVIAITGSAGKTTFKDMLYYALSAKFKVVRTHQNQNNEVGVPLTILNADHTTDILLVEMGLRNRGDLSALVPVVRPTHVVITNVGHAHIANLGSRAAIARAKSKLFRKPVQSETGRRIAFINFSSHHHRFLSGKAMRCGYAVVPFEGASASEQNFNGVVAIAKQFGLSDSEIRAGLAQYQPSAHRMVNHAIGNITLLDDSYNANPEAMIYAFHHLNRFKGRKGLVLGEMAELGDFALDEHQRVLDEVAKLDISWVMTLGPMWGKVKDNGVSITRFYTVESLIDQLKCELKPHDVVLVKGSRSTQMERVVDALLA